MRWLPGLILAASCGDAAGTGIGRWEPRADAPTARSEAGVALARGKLITVGGFSNTVELYDIASDTWSSGTDFVTRADHVTAVSLPTEEKIMVAGWNGGPGSRVEVFTYDPADDLFLPAAELRRGVQAGALVREGQTVFLIGGRDGPELTDIQLYDVVDGTWRIGPPMSVARHHLAAAVLDGKIYVTGGRSGDEFVMDVVEVFDIESERWSEGTPLQVARSGHASATLNGKIYVFGGEGTGAKNGVFAQVEEYDPASESWRFVAPMPVPRHGIMAIPVEDRIHIPLGADAIGLNNVATHDVFFPPM